MDSLNYHAILGTEIKNNLQLQYKLAWQNNFSENIKPHAKTHS